MIPILYRSFETDFTKNGIGLLPDSPKCKVTEELNGKYECEFTYPTTGQFYSELSPDRIIKAKANETSAPQLFRIYRHTKPMNNIVKFYCQHISYDLNGNTVTPFALEKTNATTVLNAILGHCYYSHRFTAVSSSSTQSKFELKVPVSARKCLGGMEGSILDNFKGEFEFDNFIIRHYKARGQDNGVVIQYGKNLTDITADTSIESTYTSVYPYATDEDGEYYELPEKVIELPSKSKYGEPRMLQLDLSAKFDSETRITAELLRQYTNQYIANNNIDDIKQNIKVSFVQLWKSKEYETIALLERVKLGDIVTVKYPKLGVSVKAKVIKTVYDVLNERYEEIELGQAKSNFADTLSKATSDLKAVSDFVRTQPSVMEKAIKSATDTITGQTGGYVVLNSGDNDYPNEILIMNKPTIETATKMWRWNLGGLGYSSTGYNGTFGTAITMNGEIVADFITAGTLNADLIKAGTIQDVNEKVSINMTTGKITMDMLNNFRSEWWTGGLTFYSPDDDVLTSMFISDNGKGVLTANNLYIGTRDSEKVRIYELGQIALLDNNTILAEMYIDNNNKGVVYANKMLIDSISITKNSNNKLLINSPVVSNFSIEHNGLEIGSFYGSQQGNSVLNVDIINVDNTISVDTIQPKTANGQTNISYLSSNVINLKSNATNMNVGSFFVNANGKSFLQTDVISVDGNQYHDTTITIDGQTYHILAR